MSAQEYAKNIITEDLMPPQLPEAIKSMEDQARAGRTIDRTMMLGIQDSILKGSFFAGCEWVWGLSGNGSVNTELPHSHDFDEVIGFMGSQKSHPRDLGGEIEFWMGGEPYIITKSCLIFVPKGVIHNPLIWRRVDSPIFMFEAGNNASYEKIV